VFLGQSRASAAPPEGKVVFVKDIGALPHVDIGGEFKKWGKILLKRDVFASQWGVSIIFRA
jgi:hypothetical protein